MTKKDLTREFVPVSMRRFDNSEFSYSETKLARWLDDWRKPDIAVRNE